MRGVVCIRYLMVVVTVAIVVAVGRPASPSPALAEGFSYRVDPTLRPVLATLPGLGRGTERTVAAVRLPNGVQNDFVVNEVILSNPTSTQLDNFIGTYGAEILVGAGLPAAPGNLPPDKLRSAYANGEDYLLRVNLNMADTSGFVSWMEQLGFAGEHVFSSDDAVRLNAIVAKERAVNDLPISFNQLVLPPELPSSLSTAAGLAVQDGRMAGPASADCVMCATQEYATTTGYANSFTFSWLNDADLLVTRAWQYYDLLGLSSHPVLAMVDLGFALNADFLPPNQVPQYDFIGEDYSVNNEPNDIIGARWHGAGTLGLAAAHLNDRFGTAGTGGQVAFPYLFKPDWTFYGISRAIRTAVYWGADVVNVSAAAPGGLWDWISLKQAVNKVNSAGVIVLVTAGNNGANMDSTAYLPCAIQGFLCVGGIDLSTKKAAAGSNYGAKVDAWGPYNGLLTTPNPDSNGDLVGFGGTCGASAYMAGIVTLMKAVSPTLNYAGAVRLLKGSANASTDPKLAAGYVNALAAIKAAAASAGLQPHGDAYEPNDTAAGASPLSPGVTSATIAPGDVDYFTFTTDDYKTLYLDVLYDDQAAPGNGLLARLDKVGGKVTFSRDFLPPGKHVLEVYGKSTEVINCYHVYLATTSSKITPDKYDDQSPAGEPRNDTFAGRAVIAKALQANQVMPVNIIYDLNFDVVGDTDFFEVTLPPAVDTLSGRSECLSPGTYPYGEPGFSQGHVMIGAYPEPGGKSSVAEGYAWPFEIKVYTASGSVFTSTTGLNVIINCPHQHFPDGRVRFSVRGKDGRRNFYRIFIQYAYWDMPLNIPDWVWTQTRPPLVRVVPPYMGLVRQLYPFDPAVAAQWAAGTAPDPLAVEYAVFNWGERRDADLYLFAEGSHYMKMTLYDSSHQLIAVTSVGAAGGLHASDTLDDGHIHVSDLPAGTYVLALEGDVATIYSVSVGPPYLSYLPLVLR